MAGRSPFGADPDAAVCVISVAAELAGVHPQTLRIYERRGLLRPARTSGGTKVIFRLARAGGGYTVKDINMRGVWLAQQMRSTFVGTINRAGSIDALFDYLGS